MCTVYRHRLEEAMDTIMETFQRYAGKGGDRFQLNFVELKHLIQTEMNIKDSWDPVKVLNIMDALDTNNDGNVSFEEFMCLISQMMVTCKPYFKEYTPMVFQCGQISDCGVMKL